MVTSYKIKIPVAALILFIIVMAAPQNSIAQRFNHPVMGGGGGFANRSATPAFNTRPAATPAPTRPAPATAPSRPAPSFNRSTPAPVPVAQQPQQSRSTINGGSWNNGNHNFTRGNAVNAAPTRPVAAAPAPVSVHVQKPGENGHGNNMPRNINAHQNSNAFHSHNNYAHTNYSYHPNHWGASWHPIGFLAATLAADAYLFSIANQQYYYDDGVYYQPSSNGYSVVSAPVGAIVSALPVGYENVQLGDDYYYYYGGTFYIGVDQGYQVVNAPIGAVVTDIPDGATDQVINGQDYLVYNNTYYEPVSQDGEDAYQVVQVY